MFGWPLAISSGRFVSVAQKSMDGDKGSSSPRTPPTMAWAWGWAPRDARWEDWGQRPQWSDWWWRTGGEWGEWSWTTPVPAATAGTVPPVAAPGGEAGESAADWLGPLPLQTAAATAVGPSTPPWAQRNASQRARNMGRSWMHALEMEANTAAEAGEFFDPVVWVELNISVEKYRETRATKDTWSEPLSDEIVSQTGPQSLGGLRVCSDMQHATGERTATHVSFVADVL